MRDQDDVKHNLGNCPNDTQTRRLRAFREMGLWDYSVQRRTRFTCPVEFIKNPDWRSRTIFSAQCDATPRLIEAAKSSDKAALIL